MGSPGGTVTAAVIIQIIALSQRQPAWLTQAVEDYQKRFPPPYRVEVIELPLQKRANITQLATIRAKESRLMMDKMVDKARRIALAVNGRPYDSYQLATELQQTAENFSIMQCFIGGPEGLSEACVAKCQQRWSLSNLTLPHGIARLVAIEALYRAWSINHQHPYHR